MAETTLKSLKLKLTTDVKELDQGLKLLMKKSEDLSLDGTEEQVNNIVHQLDTEDVEHLKISN